MFKVCTFCFNAKSYRGSTSYAQLCILNIYPIFSDTKISHIHNLTNTDLSDAIFYILKGVYCKKTKQMCQITLKPIQ